MPNPMQMPIVIAALILIAINLLTVLRFWQDKRYAIVRARRIPESSLLGLALIGGSPGALLARHLFRHKTRKEPFSTCLLLITVIQIGVIIGFTLF